MSKKLHVALILEDMFPDSSGVSRSVQMQIDELTNLGHQVTLLAPEVNLTPPLNANIVPLPSFRLPGLPLHTRIINSSEKLAKKISAEHKFDIIHSQTDTGAVILAARIARLQQIPHLHTFHTNMAGAHNTTPLISFIASFGYRLNAHKIGWVGAYSKPVKSLDKQVLANESRIGLFDWRSQAIIASKVSAITTPSKYMLRYIKAAGANIDDQLSASIPTGYSRAFEKIINAMNSQKDTKKLRFITISRIVKEKRLKNVIAAFKKANIENSELLIIGDGVELGNLKAQAQGAKNIIFTGHIGDQREIAKYLKSSDVFILASYRFDNQPIVITEALAAGVPLLYCDDRLDVGLNKSNSLLVEPSTSSLSDGMMHLADDKLRHKLKQGTKSVFEELSPEATSRAYVKLYKATIESFKS